VDDGSSREAATPDQDPGTAGLRADPGSTVDVLAAVHPSGPRQLLAFGPRGGAAVHELPEDGSLSMGRGDDTDVHLPDPSASRRHARLHIGAGNRFAIEDLGSANGTLVDGRRLAEGERASIREGQVVFIGSTMILVEPKRTRARVRRSVPSDRFEVCLADACFRAAHTGDEVAIVLIEVLDGFLHDKVVQMGQTACVGSAAFMPWGPGRHAALFPAAPPDGIIAGLRELGPGVVWITARFPAEGRDPEQLLVLAETKLEAACLAVEPGAEVIFCDEHMRRLYALLRQAASGQVSVLVLGETGVGKDVMARAVHRLSPRTARPFQRVDCAALTEALAESELFGHEPGAFTGAVKAKPGLIEAADGGTVFLDEVGELPPRLQAKLLHVLEARQVTRVGSVKARAIDVRFVAATNRDLQEEVARGVFRKDLYYRLSGFSISIPPLRARPAEIAPLARAQVRACCRQLGRVQVPVLSPEAVANLEAHPWPGNVRELRNTIERAVLLGSGDRIEPADLVFDGTPGGGERTAADSSGPVRLSTDELEERDRIERALLACGGNQSRAARLLGIARSTLTLRLDAFAIVRPRKRL
jgi:DNA-binding NtrC family response regulator